MRRLYDLTSRQVQEGIRVPGTIGLGAHILLCGGCPCSITWPSNALPSTAAQGRRSARPACLYAAARCLAPIAQSGSVDTSLELADAIVVPSLTPEPTEGFR